MAQDVIAIICDCDGTLCPDTSDRLVRELGIDSREFWKNRVNPLVEDGWDPPLAYLQQLLVEARESDGGGLTQERLNAVGAGVEFYPGALDFVPRLRALLSANADFAEANVTIEWFIVSSGIEAVLTATPLVTEANEIFGCAYAYDDEGRAVAVKRAVTFTEKTKFIYSINKGISGAELRRNPYRVNDAMGQADRRVPFRNMIYVGDGPSDIPCFSMIRYLGGKAVGVTPPDDSDFRRPYELAEGQRLTVGPYTANYEEGSDLYRMMARLVTGIADSILEEREHSLRRAPSH
ncbi:MAG: hypothetical protein OXE17_09270 [Chloroflexi bacterium]|nr:hypothetical protein [Chloroflexota bacterium]